MFNKSKRTNNSTRARHQKRSRADSKHKRSKKRFGNSNASETLSDEVARLKAPPEVCSSRASDKKGGKGSYEAGEKHFTAKKWKEAIVSYQ